MARRLAIVAGHGSLVPEAISHARRKGWDVLVLSAVPRPDIEGVDVAPFDLSDPVVALSAVREFGATDLLMIGGVTLPDAAREKLAGAFSGKAANGPQGDTGLSHLGTGVERLTGARLMGIHELMPDLLAGEGVLAGPEPGSRIRSYCRFALDAAKRIGALDAGQAVVCAGERIIAVEDIAGTDALLQRVADYRGRGLTGDGDAPLVLAKAVKPGQPLQVDLPAIGPVTVERADEAGVSVIVVEAGWTLLAGAAELKASAEARGITLLGMKPDGRT